MPDFVYVLMLIWGMAFLVSSGAFAVRLYRSEGAPKTPVGGKSTSSRNVPPTGPKQPESPVPPTGTFRCRHRVALGDPSLSATLSSGWRLR